VLVFFLLPAFLSGLLARLPGVSAWVSNLIEGGIRLAILILYLWIIGQMPEIKRVFMYHGAEHKTINAFENGVPLTPENIKAFPVEHGRCGTSFILTLVIMSIIVFTLIGPLPLHWRIITRILMIPILAGLSYEYMRLISKNLDSPVGKAIIMPNLFLQKMTTKEPTTDMIEVSIRAFNEMREMEKES
jgi:uncharacterized protein YqhQ